jgi:hypothetical protein
MRMVTRAAAVAAVAAVAVGVAGPSAHAESAEVDVSLSAAGPTTVLVNSPVGFSLHLNVPDPDVPAAVTVTVTVDFAQVIGSVERINSPSSCTWQSPHYVCQYQFAAGSTPALRVLSFGVAPTPGAVWTTGRVRAVATVGGATDPHTANNTVDHTLDVRTNRADVAAELLGPGYQLVGDGGVGGFAVNVHTPNPGQRVTLAATFDFRAVQHAVAFSPDDPGDCSPEGAGRYRCEQEVNGSGRTSATLFVTHSFLVSPLSSGPTGPAGQVHVTVEQVGGVDPNLSNNSVSGTLDVVRGQWRGMVDFGDVTGRVGETVTAPVTITNTGPNTFEYIAIGHAPRYGGVELVGYSGCASNPRAFPDYCATPLWFTPGSTVQVGIRLRITRCPDGDGVGGIVSASKARVDSGGVGKLTVIGCAGAGPVGGGAGGGGQATGGGPVVDDGAPDGAATVGSGGGGEGESAGTPAPGGPLSPTGAPLAAAGSGGSADAAGDLVPVGQRRLDAGLGLTGLILLLGLLATARGARWMVIRRVGAG